MTHESAWIRCSQIIQRNLPLQTFKTWFIPIEPLALEDHTLTVKVPNQFFYDWLEQHYPHVIKKALFDVIGIGAKISYVVEEKDEQEPFRLSHFRPAEQDAPSRSLVSGREERDYTNFEHPLNEQYVFESFVEGSSNQFAKAAALAVAQEPGKTSFNPLVIYGGVGLGKTHLLQAIGNFVLSRHSNLKVVYVSSEKFTIEFVNAIQKNAIHAFTKFYRGVDVLLMDDIQFFGAKEKTQDEFFHTFNTLHQMGKQIILTSDRPPKEIKQVEERLISRFQWGLVTDIQPPDLETRIAILQKKSEEDDIFLPPEIYEFIAVNVTTNIRELEGSLIKLLAFSSLNKIDMTLDLAKKVLKDTISGKKKNVSIEDIQKIVSDYFHIPEDMLRAKSRKQEIVLARQICMHLCKVVTGSSLKTIGLHFGGRDHTTVIHSCQSVEKMYNENEKIKDDVDTIRRKVELSCY